MITNPSCLAGNNAHQVIQKFTTTLSEALTTLGDSLTPEAMQGMYEQILSYKYQYEQARATLGPVLAMVNFLAFIDTLIAEHDDIYANIKCTRGCAACCKYKVLITEDEAEVILERCRQKNIHIN